MNQENKELLESYNEYLMKLEPGIKAVIEDVRSKEFNQNIDILLKLIEGLTWIATANSNLQNCVDLKPININKLNDINKELIDSIDGQDSYLCADILEYELLDFVLDLEKNI